MVHDFPHPILQKDLPDFFNDPFDYTPHPLCVEAAQEVQRHLSKMELWKRQQEEGKMFGVLIVRTQENQIGYLAAFSGILDGSYLHPYFVPPIYNLQHPDSFFPQEEARISALNKQIEKLEYAEVYLEAQNKVQQLQQEATTVLQMAQEKLQKAKKEREWKRQQPHYDADALIHESQHQKAEYKRLQKNWKERIEQVQGELQILNEEIERLKKERKQRSSQLQQRLFKQFQLRNARGEIRDVYSLFQTNSNSNPPAGTGECAAPKLLQYAYEHHLTPIAMAEFWWGNSPKTEIRQSGNFYPACRGKCGPILPFMLQGLSVQKASSKYDQVSCCFPEIVYEDEWMVVVNKPAGLLVVPGKTAQISLYELVRQRYPKASGPLIVHRLDMATSGLLIVAKDSKTHTHLQHQFLHRKIQKRYIALLDGNIETEKGILSLPLCPDIHDRPRQMVHDTLGKPAITQYEVLERTPHYTRIAFYPITGRTHQLRVHAAHPRGLHAPIVGDPLYGQKAERLYLHAESLTFCHPTTRDFLTVEKKADF